MPLKLRKLNKLTILKWIFFTNYLNIHRKSTHHRHVHTRVKNRNWPALRSKFNDSRAN